jgi:acetoin utilization deacetylase AcuC-like enzyme
VRPVIFYSDGYYADIGAHVFPMVKYRLIRAKLDGEKITGPADFVEPEPATPEDALLVHTSDYIEKLLTGTLSAREIATLELPYSRELVETAFLGAGGTIAAVRSSFERGVGVNLAGGFHHAYADHGEGFCVLNDVAMGAARAVEDGLAERAAIVDCDVHHGNGTASIFADDDRVFTFSIHQEFNYPYYKPPSNLDVGLPNGADGNMYLEQLEKALDMIFERFDPELVLYVAGADPYRHDLLGGLGLTRYDLGARDQMVIRTCTERRIPVTVTLAGGYAARTEDTVAIQADTVAIALAAGEELEREQAPRETP